MVKPSDLVQQRVRVFWPDDRAWFTGVVTSYSSKRGHCVKFDKVEGEDDCVRYYESFDEVRWELLTARRRTPSPPNRRPARRPNRVQKWRRLRKAAKRRRRTRAPSNRKVMV